MKSFLNTKKEKHAWHKGFWTGLKYFHPSKLVSNLEVSNHDSFSNWEDSEGHYTDPLAVAMFGLKYAALASAALILGIIELGASICL